MKIAVLTIHPTPYRDPFWNVVSQQGIDLKVYFLVDKLSDRPWSNNWQQKFDSYVLPGLNVGKLLSKGKYSYWNPSIRKELSAGKYDAVIIAGYSHPTMIAAILWCQLTKTPYFLMSESYLHEPRSKWKVLLKYPLVRWAVANARGCFPTGQWAKEYLTHYGADPTRQWFVPNVPDVSFLQDQAKRNGLRRDEIRSSLGLPDKPTLLFVGRLVGFKKVDVLLRAFAIIREKQSAHLAIVGDGPERGILVALCEQLGLNSDITFAGFTEPEKVPEWYAAADLFVLPSLGETWSVAIIEALASNLPVITTTLVGAAPDVIKNTIVGRTVLPDSPEQLANEISNMLSNSASKQEVANAWIEVRDSLDYEKIATTFVKAIRSSIE